MLTRKRKREKSKEKTGEECAERDNKKREKNTMIANKKVRRDKRRGNKVMRKTLCDLQLIGVTKDIISDRGLRYLTKILCGIPVDDREKTKNK